MSDYKRHYEYREWFEDALLNLNVALTQAPETVPACAIEVISTYHTFLKWTVDAYLLELEDE